MDEKLVMVYWRDSHAEAKAWTHRSHIDCDPLPIQSVGWLIYDAPNTITVAAHRSQDSDEVGGSMTIPKSAVVSMEEIKAPRKKPMTHRRNE